MLEREDAELQRELGHLLAALIQMQPLLHNLQLEVREQRWHAACEKSVFTSIFSYVHKSFCLSTWVICSPSCAASDWRWKVSSAPACWITLVSRTFFLVYWLTPGSLE